MGGLYNLQTFFGVYNFIVNTSKQVLFLPPSDAYVRSFLYLLYTLIKLYYTKALSDQASSLAPDWILLLQGPRIPVYSRDSTTTFQGSFSMSWFFASGGQSIGASASVSVLPMNIQGWFPLRLTGLISLLSKGLSRVFSSTTVWKHLFFGTLPSLWSNSHVCTWLLENHSFDLWTFVSKVMSLLFNHCLGLS